ncbi:MULTISPECIES: hypothetical protein [Ensifer]|jgi:hypothetical protein|uniref:hypothetical protein n=1 Tax=Ensifer TaxID=106591 RepID=UPI000A883673|nr:MULTISPECIES: hypothetical protein [Ensifer]NOV14707.1 hypothetical protein [Ensifer canadensis]UBI76642.1 hypothetical protein J3R84_05770 [Ensifer canadensis]
MFIGPAARGDRIDGNLNNGASLSAMNKDKAGTSAGLAGFPPDKCAQNYCVVPGSNLVFGSLSQCMERHDALRAF